MKFLGRSILLVLLVVLTLSLWQCGKGASDPKSFNIQVVSGRTMGTSYSVKFCLPQGRSHPDAPFGKEIQTGVDGVLKEVNRQMSTYIPNSELSLFNAYEGGDWFAVSKDLAALVRQSIDVAVQSDGAFDITVGPLVNLWGFGPKKMPERVPDEATIRKTMEYTGYKKISVRLAPPALKKELPQVYCDLSGIAKGFAVDKVGAYLETRGIVDYMVEIGGEVLTKGSKAPGKPWIIGIAAPGKQGGLQKTLALRGVAMATSGDYHNYFEVDGARYSHTIDPQTGRPVTHKLASVSVIHPSCAYADAVATAIDVLGPEKGYRLATYLDLPVFMIIRQGDKFIEKTNPAFERILEGE